MIRVLLVDDHPLLRQGLGALINGQTDMSVCGEAATLPEAMTAIPELKPDVVVLDLSLKDSSGLDLIKKVGAEVRILVLSMHDEMLYAERALRAGAKGYIMKQEASEQVLTAIRKVVGGELYLSGQMASHLLQRLSQGTNAPSVSPLERLTDRELEVFTLIGKGLPTREIAEKLSLSVKTVETHRERMKDKLGLRNGNELVRIAIRHVENAG